MGGCFDYVEDCACTIYTSVLVCLVLAEVLIEKVVLESFLQEIGSLGSAGQSVWPLKLHTEAREVMLLCFWYTARGMGVAGIRQLFGSLACS